MHYTNTTKSQETQLNSLVSISQLLWMRAIQINKHAKFARICINVLN